MSRLWIIAYDIENDRSRRRVHNLLKDYGERVQFSVFECQLDERSLASLRASIKEELGDGDNVRCYPLCSWCKKQVSWQGIGLAVDDPKFYLL